AGWHHARILVGPADAGTHVANAKFYVDDMVNAAFSHDLPAGNVGFNSIHTLACTVFQPAASETAGFFDDVTFQAANDPYIVEQPVSRTNAYLTTATFTVVAMGTSYQWQKDGHSIAGATSATLTLNGVSSLNEGSYTCVVTGANGSLTSSAATLTVNGSPPLLTATLVGQKVVITWTGSYPLLSPAALRHERHGALHRGDGRNQSLHQQPALGLAPLLRAGAIGNLHPTRKLVSIANG
ncbi:MAG: hypothetical protein NTV92_07055, partial [Candidatus Bipolaricaulota bacterium]|nr:hypothetical protein [Candidatus Bipolaricaulota bacterium]